MKKILYIFLFGSIISMILSFIFPILLFNDIYFDIPYWIYGSPNPGSIIIDISQKIISLLYIIITIFLIRSIFLSKNSESIHHISEKWQEWGIVILILYFLWNMITLLVGIMTFMYPYGYKFTFAFFFPIISGALLIIARILQTRVIGKGLEEKCDYMNVNWLKHQYYDIGKSIQDIANEQNTSLITIRKWLDKIENSSQNKNDNNSANSKT